MTSEENRSQSNLLLLCFFHSVLIDQHPDQYPAQLLREWKQAAESGDGTGVDITDDEIEEVVRVWVQQDITISAETITLGGTLGGGGGAIGYGAFGGRGGNIASFPELQRFALAENPASQPNLGRGYSEGFDGQPGGPTAIWREDGEVLAAVGGGGGDFAGTGRRSTTDVLGVSALMLANHVDVTHNLCTVIKGAWSVWNVTAFPEEVLFVALIVVEAGGVEVGEYTVHVALVGPGDAEVARTSFPVLVEERGELLRILRWVPLNVHLEHAGIYRLVASSASQELASLPLAVRLTSDSEPSNATPPTEADSPTSD